MKKKKITNSILHNIGLSYLPIGIFMMSTLKVKAKQSFLLCFPQKHKKEAKSENERRDKIILFAESTYAGIKQ